jgi:hypothetical protein
LRDRGDPEVNKDNLIVARDRQIAATVVAAFGAFGAVPVALLVVVEVRGGSVGPLTAAGALIVGAAILACVLPMRRPATAALCALAATGAMVFLALDAYPSVLGAVLFIPAVELVLSAGLALEARRLRASAS